jgi:hypothetical protein
MLAQNYPPRGSQWSYSPLARGLRGLNVTGTVAEHGAGWSSLVSSPGS